MKESGPRNRRDYSASDRAFKELEDNWKKTASHYIGDCDAVLRLCKAAEAFNLPEGVEYARAAVKLRRKELAKYRDAKGRIVAPEMDYRSYESYSEVARFHQLQAEERTLNALVTALCMDL